MALVPIMALAGIFGERRELREAGQGSLAVSARVPTRFRYGQHMTTEIRVTNRGSEILRDVRVRIDPAYLARFSDVTFSLPSMADGSVSLGTLAPRQSAWLFVTVDGDESGAFRGDAVITDATADTAHIALTSTVFP